ncbi:hypothetical protein BH20VER3_BH20VER3_16160 [soil metagenome]
MGVAQSELEFRELRATDWLFVKRLLHDLHEDFARKERFLLLITSRWMIALELFRFCEELTILQGNATETDVAYHKGILAILRGLGVLLTNDLKNHEEISLDQLNITFGDIDALVRELQYDEAMHYGLATAERIEEIESVLDG